VSFRSLFKGLGGQKEDAQEVTGVVVGSPLVRQGDVQGTRIRTFRLDCRPDLEFCETIRGLSADRKSGDKLKVKFKANGGERAEVEWIERM